MAKSIHAYMSKESAKLRKSKTKSETWKWTHKQYIQGLIKMKQERVLQILKEQGIDINVRTLQRYAKENLIPKPKTMSAGRDHGRITDCSEDTPAQVVALHHTLGLFGKLTKKDIEKIRKIALIKLKYVKAGYGDLNGTDLVGYMVQKDLKTLESIPEEERKVIDLLAVNWLLAYGVLESISPIEDAHDIEGYKKELSFVTELYPSELISKAIKTLRSLDI